MTKILAADIGGTNVRLALIDQHGSIHHERREHAQLSQFIVNSKVEAEAHLINALCGVIQPYIADHQISQMGIGFPGFFYGNSGVLAASPNLPLIEEFPLAERLSDQLGIDISIQNDALCAAIGEHRYGAGQGQNNLLHITLGTGVGGGLILNNTPYTGEHGMAMEFGHLCVEQVEGRSCGCGNHGCVEAYASATAICKRFSEITGQKHDAKTIYQLSCDGDQIAATIFNDAGLYLGKAIAEAIKLLDLSTVTISGGLGHAWPLLHKPLMEGLNSGVIPPLRGKVKVLRSTLDDNAGLLGAAAITRQS